MVLKFFQRPLEVCVLKTASATLFLFTFGNSSGIYPTSWSSAIQLQPTITSASHISVSRANNQGGIFNISKHSVSQQSSNLSARSAVMDKRKDFTLCVLNSNFPYCILGSVGPLSACSSTEACLFFITFSHLHRSWIFCCSACRLMLSGKITTDLKDMFNSRYIYNKQITA